MKYITDESIKNAFLTMMNKLVFGYDFILKPLHTAIIRVNIEKSGQRLKELDALMKDNVEQRKTTAGLLSKGYIDRANIDMIITKSISRFARNTLDCLKYIRQLKEKNIPVFFEKENINTLDSKGEVLLTIMASLAQQESESLKQY